MQCEQNVEKVQDITSFIMHYILHVIKNKLVFLFLKPY